MNKMALRLTVLVIAVALPFGGTAQRRRGRLAMATTTTEWTVFVQIPGEAGRRATTDSTGAAPIDMGSSDWVCSYGTPSRAQVDANNWSEVRTLECRRGDAVVSTTGFCHIAGTTWGSRAAMLSLGLGAVSARTQVTLDCAVRTR